MDSDLCSVEMMDTNAFRTLRLSKAQLWTAFGPHQTLQSKYPRNMWYYTVCEQSQLLTNENEMGALYSFDIEGVDL